MTGGGKTILVADDNADLVKMVKSHLSRLGFNVVTASDGEEAILAAKKQSPDLILLDLDMPKKSGLDVCKAIQTPHGRLKYPVILFTGHCEFEDTFKDIGVEGFLPKPFEMQDLSRKIEAILSRLSKTPVLLIDRKDEPRTAEIAGALTRERYRTILAEDLEGAREALGSGAPDYIFIEYLRNDMDGNEFIRKVRAAAPKTPLIVYSYSGLDYSDKSLKAGADKYIGKPPSYSAFIAAIREFELKR